MLKCFNPLAEVLLPTLFKEKGFYKRSHLLVQNLDFSLGCKDTFYCLDGDTQYQLFMVYMGIFYWIWEPLQLPQFDGARKQLMVNMGCGSNSQAASSCFGSSKVYNGSSKLGCMQNAVNTYYCEDSVHNVSFLTSDHQSLLPIT